MAVEPMAPAAAGPTTILHGGAESGALPSLVSWACSERECASELPSAAKRTDPGELFTVEDQPIRRSVMETPEGKRTWVKPPDGGKRVDLMLEEHRAFWIWSMEEVLRLTGIRIE